LSIFDAPLYKFGAMASDKPKIPEDPTPIVGAAMVLMGRSAILVEGNSSS
jgi:hypothetical protein